MRGARPAGWGDTAICQPTAAPDPAWENIISFVLKLTVTDRPTTTDHAGSVLG